MADGLCKAQTGSVDNKVRLEYHSALVGLLLSNLMEEAHKVYTWGIVAMTTKQLPRGHCTVQVSELAGICKISWSPVQLELVAGT